MKWMKDRFMISDDPAILDIETISCLLGNTYWAAGRSKETIEKSIENSVVFGVYHEDRQIGFARVISDKAVFSYLLDVVIEPHFRGKGLGQWLMESILTHPDLMGTNFALATKDAQDFYKKFSFREKEVMTRSTRQTCSANS